MITVRNTTTPDSATTRITVTGAATPLEAMDAAVAFMASSRYLKGATIFEHTRDGERWDFHAEWADAPATACTCHYNTHRPHGQHTRTDITRDPRCPVKHQ